MRLITVLILYSNLLIAAEEKADGVSLINASVVSAIIAAVGGVTIAIVKILSDRPIKQLGEMKKTVEDFIVEMDNKMKVVDYKMDGLVKTVNSLSNEFDNHNNFVIQLLKVYDAYNDLHTFDTAMESFVTYKNEAFDEFALRLDEMITSNITFEAIVSIATKGSEQVRHVGYAMVGKPFVEKFYETHAEEMNEYMSMIKVALESNDIGTRRIHSRAASLKFKKDFNVRLSQVYIQFSHLIIREGE